MKLFWQKWEEELRRSKLRKVRKKGHKIEESRRKASYIKERQWEKQAWWVWEERNSWLAVAQEEGAHKESTRVTRAGLLMGRMRKYSHGGLQQGCLLQAASTGNFQWEPDFTGQWGVLGFSSVSHNTAVKLCNLHLYNPCYSNLDKEKIASCQNLFYLNHDEILPH